MALQQCIEDMTERHFPLKTIHRRENDLPWIDETAKKMIGKKKAVYKAEGTSVRWEALRSKLDLHLSKRQESYLARQRDKMTGADASVVF